MICRWKERTCLLYHCAQEQSDSALGVVHQKSLITMHHGERRSSWLHPCLRSFGYAYLMNRLLPLLHDLYDMIDKLLE